MTPDELIRKPPSEVRQNGKLMRRYIEIYTAFFHRRPNCASCTFYNDWKKLVRLVQQGKTEKIMSKKKDYVLKKKYDNTILTIKVGKHNQHVYGRNATQEFLMKFLNAGISPKKKSDRQAMFEKYPKPKRKTKRKRKPKKDE